MATTITVSGSDATAYVCDPSAGGALTFVEALGQRNTLNVSFHDPAGAWIPARGQEIIFHHDTLGDLFGGYIGTVVWYKIAGGEPDLFADCTCVSFEQMLDRRYCWAHCYTGNGFGEIVRDIIVNSLGADGFSAALVADGGEIVMGPTIDLFEIVEPRPTIKQAIEQLCTLATTGTDIYYWDATPGKVIRAFVQGTYNAPFDITDASLNGLLQDCKITETNTDMANRVFVYLGEYLLDAVTETVHGDGSTSTFDTTMPIGAAPTLALNSVAIAATDIGINGVDTGKRYYWAPGSAQIYQDGGETLLTSGDNLDITYQGLDAKTLPPINDSGAIATEVTLQGGGTGYYEAYVTSDTPAGAADGAALGQAYLDRSKTATVTFEGATYTPGLRCGQEITISLTAAKINRTMLIQSVTATDQGAGRLLWSFVAIDGPYRADWKKRLLGTAESSSNISSSVAVAAGSSGSSGATNTLSTILTLTSSSTTLNVPVASAPDGWSWSVMAKQDASGNRSLVAGTGVMLLPIIGSDGAGGYVNSEPSTMCLMTFQSFGGNWYCTSSVLGVAIV
jgi:hypothetical protein